MELSVNLRERHFVLDMPPLYSKVGFSRVKGGFERRANIALFYSRERIRLARALGRGMRLQRRKPRVAIYNNTVQVIGSIEPINDDCRAALAKMRFPPLAKVCEVFSIASVAHFSPEEMPTFAALFTEQGRFTVEVYGPRGESLKAFETFEVCELGECEIQVVL